MTGSDGLESVKLGQKQVPDLYGQSELRSHSASLKAKTVYSVHKF
jgi:hypothetical protein